MTRNERIQQLLSEGLSEARRRNMGAQEEGFCAAYLAGKCAMPQEQQARLGVVQETRKIASWMRKNPNLVSGILRDINPAQLANFTEIPAFLGGYILEELHRTMMEEKRWDEHNGEMIVVSSKSTLLTPWLT